MKSIIEVLNESYKYNYNKSNFDPRDCWTWLIKTNQVDDLKDKYLKNIEEYAELVQAAAENAGIPLEDAERIYDYICDSVK